MIIPLVGKFAGSLLGTWVARQDVFSLLVLVMIAYIALVPQSTMTIREFVDDWVLPNQQDYVVIDDGAVAGVASLAGLRAVPRAPGLIQDSPACRCGSRPTRNRTSRSTRYSSVTDHRLSVIPVLDDAGESWAR